ncbi:MAG: cell division ATP-binding protein FtsE [Minisyncoccus archaeiphilus]|uniref:cell division ATP-binding protein FtsE n=1 Tax=Minisyncoccus archaeiphilus TaxID=3238481 RepID=UPI002B07FFBF|nr:MAG: cell division ATP-binding protein FtsE [Candidatus Parcubacteria bacterium]
MIEFKKVTKDYISNIGKEVKPALKDVSFSVKEGEFVTLCGRSGAGKTTILKMIACEEKPNSGNVFFFGQDTAKIKKGQAFAIRQQVGFIFQDFKLLSYKTVFENVFYALEVTNQENKKTQDDVMKVLDLVGLSKKFNRFPRELSGGEQQRVCIARALIHRPKVILADEPTGNLDPYHSRDIMKMLMKINEGGATIILSTHDKEIVNSIKKRVITVEDGKIIRDEENGMFFI